MADNWTRLGDAVANLVALHNAAESDERGYREELVRMTSDKSKQSRMLAQLNQTNRDLQSKVAKQRNEIARLTQSLEAATAELTKLRRPVR